VRGSKADAVTLLGKRLAERGEGRLAVRSHITVAEYARHWLKAIAVAKTGGKTRERHGDYIEKHILPPLGGVQLQKLDGTDHRYLLRSPSVKEGTPRRQGPVVTANHQAHSQTVGANSFVCRQGGQASHVTD